MQFPEPLSAHWQDGLSYDRFLFEKLQNAYMLIISKSIEIVYIVKYQIPTSLLPQTPIPLWEGSPLHQLFLTLLTSFRPCLLTKVQWLVWAHHLVPLSRRRANMSLQRRWSLRSQAGRQSFSWPPNNLYDAPFSTESVLDAIILSGVSWLVFMHLPSCMYKSGPLRSANMRTGACFTPSSCANVALSWLFWGELDSIPDHRPTLALVSVCGDRWHDSVLPDTRER